MPTAVSLFTGCGGSDAGLRRAGIDTVFANDILPSAKAFYSLNMPETDYFLGDVREIESVPSADILVGCYPCQGFSQGGARRASRKINYLYRSFDKILRKMKPKAFIVENVSGMSRSDFKHLLNNQIVRFRTAGYLVNWKILNARDYGLAQNRKRLFIVGIRSDLGLRYEFPEPKFGLSEPSASYRTIRDVIGHLPLWPNGEFYDADFHWYYLSRDRSQDWDGQSKTIVANQRHIPLHPISPRLIKLGPDKWVFESTDPARRLSYRECALLQGFDRNIIIDPEIAMSKQYTIFGNAVPPPLFEAVAAALPDIW